MNALPSSRSINLAQHSVPPTGRFIILLSALAGFVNAQTISKFDPPGTTRSVLDAISENGEWAVGTALLTDGSVKGLRAKRDGTYNLFTLPTAITNHAFVHSITNDGQLVLGNGSNNLGQGRAYFWNAAGNGNGTTSILPVNYAGYDGIGDCFLNSDGTKVAVTLYNYSPNKLQAARYEPAGTYTVLNDPLPENSAVRRVVGSGTNAEVLGYRTNVGSTLPRPVSNIYGTTTYAFLDERKGTAMDRSTDAFVYVGSVYTSAAVQRAVRWQIVISNGNREISPVILGSLGGTSDEATHVNHDGSRIVGTSSSPFIWEPAFGIQNLNSALTGRFGITNPVGTFRGAVAMSKDGTQIVGGGLSGGKQVALWADIRRRFEASMIDGVRVSFPTVIGKSYEIFESSDMTNWTTTSVVLTGTGNTMDYCFPKTSRTFYKVAESN